MTSKFTVVLAGGGARGSYEAGVLSVLLPALDATGMQADVFVGTSAGAINAVGYASLSHLGAARSSAAVLDLWRQVHAGAVFRVPFGMARRSLTYPSPDRRRARALLDTSPLAATLESIVDWDQLHANVRDGRIAAVGVVTTPSSTRDSRVFLEARPGLVPPPPDETRSITYVPTTLEPRHVLASSAIPVLFPAVEIERPVEAAGWHFDGGVRMNTPIKPAMALGAERVLVVATSPAEPPAATPHDLSTPPPGLAASAAQVLYAMLDDRMVEDLRTLARRNQPDVQGDVIPWLFGGPRRDEAGLLGRLVCEVLDGPGSGRRRGPLARLTRRALARALAAGSNRAELASYLFFDTDFLEGAIRLGRRDAERSLGPDGVPVWQDPRLA